MKQIEEEIEYLNQMLMKMGDIVLENINNSYSYYKGEIKDPHINDDIVDKHERLIEEMALDIMVKEKLFASDLRRVSGILLLVNDIERIGDHAEDIETYATKLKKCKKNNVINIDEIFLLTLKMVNDCIVSFVKNDAELAHSVIKNDEIIDNLFEKCIENLKEKSEIIKDSGYIIYTTLIIKYIERIADHAVNIAEWVIYIINGYHKDKKIF